MNYPSKTFTVEEAKKKLEHYCAYRDRSHKEVKNKLNELRMIPEAQDLIILHLIQEGFLNEERFAKSFVRGKFNYKKWGKRKIVQALKRQDIQPRLIEKALEEIKEEDYQTTIEKLIRQKRKDYKEKNSYKLKQKIFQYLLQKGYAYEDFADVYSLLEKETK